MFYCFLPEKINSIFCCRFFFEATRSYISLAMYRYNQDEADDWTVVQYGRRRKKRNNECGWQQNPPAPPRFQRYTQQPQQPQQQRVSYAAATHRAPDQRYGPRRRYYDDSSRNGYAGRSADAHNTGHSTGPL